ncbi:MAG: hypothetical protein NT136_02005 [Candidatus Moranbacteria bacterium]|nr:hypothetical protein [Candidatus Moranbacteria bacterium]
MLRSRKKGFSIGEVIISLFVITVGIVAAVGLIAKSISQSIDSRNEIIAAQLAQEGAELTRNLRDNSFIVYSEDPFYWLTDGNKCIDVTKDTSATVDPNLSCSGGNYALKYDTNGRYQYGSGDATRFSRNVAIATSASPAGKRVTSTVWWSGANSPPASCTTGNKCVSVEALLTSWK